MSFALYYKLSTYALVAAGFLAAATSGFVGVVVPALLCGALVVSWVADTSRLKRSLPRWLWTALGIACVPAWYADVRWLSHSFLIGTLHLAFLLTAVTLVTRDGDRDTFLLYLLSFGALLAAATLTIQLIFLPCLILFLGAGINALLLFEMNRSSTRALAGGMIRPVYVPRNLLGTGFELFASFPSRSITVLTLALTLGILALAAPLFYLLPRISLGVRYHEAGAMELISGFSETVALGALGRIKQSPELVMKVKVDAPVAGLPQDLKWRGIALDHFDGKAWSRARSERSRIATQAGYFKVQQEVQGTDMLVQTFLLQPIATEIVFGSHKVLAVSGDLGTLERDAFDNIYSVAPRTSAMRYSVVSDITPLDPRFISPTAQAPPDEISTLCLQVPHLDARIARLAHTATASAGTPYEKARTLENFLKTTYEYSLDLKGTPDDPDPLAVFLFAARRGHCEYFASAMTVMLRQLQIPARLVNGFRAGEYNALSGHWSVRQSDAHSWVEAWFPPYGWIEFDPTPAQPAPQVTPILQSIAGLFDAVSFWWSEDVVNFDLRKQSGLIQKVLASLRTFQEAAQAAGGYVRNQREHMRAIRPLAPAIGILILAAAVLLAAAAFARRPGSWWRRLRCRLAQTRNPRDSRIVIAGFYAEALELLERRGFRRAKSQTPLEFAAELARTPCGGTLAALTAIYYRIRFGSLPHEDDLGQARALLRSLRGLS